MASLTIRNIENSLKECLRVRAARHGRSMEEEARQVLRQSLLREESTIGLGTRIAQRFSEVGGVDLPDVARSLPRRAPAVPPDDEP